MTQEYRIIIQQKSASGKYETKSVIKQGKIKKPSNILELGLRYIDQVKILQEIQDSILDMQSVDLQEDIDICPICGNKIVRHSVTKSSFNSVFTDHKIAVRRLICKKCNWRSVPSIKALFGTHMHPDLLKLQCEPEAKHTYKNAQDILKRGKIISNHCAGSALEDQNKQIKELTLVAAKKQGLTKNTHVIALCDGAKNCWDIIDSIKPHCANITKILDWFHIAMKFKNISLAEKHEELLDHVKWNIWHNKADTALFKLEELTKLIRNNENRKKLKKL